MFAQLWASQSPRHHAHQQRVQRPLQEEGDNVVSGGTTINGIADAGRATELAPRSYRLERQMPEGEQGLPRQRP